MYSHTDERPLGCNDCDRHLNKFTEYDVLECVLCVIILNYFSHVFRTRISITQIYQCLKLITSHESIAHIIIMYLGHYIVPFKCTECDLYVVGPKIHLVTIGTKPCLYSLLKHNYINYSAYEICIFTQESLHVRTLSGYDIIYYCGFTYANLENENGLALENCHDNAVLVNDCYYMFLEYIMLIIFTSILPTESGEIICKTLSTLISSEVSRKISLYIKLTLLNIVIYAILKFKTFTSKFHYGE